jgi:hypothetical protein
MSVYDDMYLFNFPPVKFIPPEGLTRAGQADHIVEEAAELYAEATSDEDVPPTRYIEELLDCIHACETALREFDREDIDRAAMAVIEKNKACGYYGDNTMSYMVIDNMLPPIDIALCYSEEEVAQHLMKFGLTPGEVPLCGRTVSEAITCSNSEDRFVACVRLSECQNDCEAMMGVLVHETTHVATRYLESIGCEVIDDEIRAYVSQSIGQALLGDYLLHMEQSEKEKDY